MILTLPQGIVGCGVSFVLVTWCIEKRGAVFVAAFIPVVQIIVSVIDFSILHEQLYLGRYVRTLTVPYHVITECLNPIHLIESEVTFSALLCSSGALCACSVLGSVLVIGGLYLLLWGKRQEALHCPPPPKVEEDAADKEQQQVQHN